MYKKTEDCWKQHKKNQSKAHHLQMLLLWPWHINLIWTFWKCTSIPKINFLGQGVVTEAHTERQREMLPNTLLHHIPIGKVMR